MWHSNQNQQAMTSTDEDSTMDPVQKESSGSPALGHVFDKSDSSGDEPPEPDCVSMRSTRSLMNPLNFGEENCFAEFESEHPRNQSTESNPVLSKEESCQHKLKRYLGRKCKCLFEGIEKQGNPSFLNEIYTELYITEAGSGEIRTEHEVRQTEIASMTSATMGTPIKCSNIFEPSPGEDKPIRSVLTKGIAGIGKTVSVQRFILDWIEGANDDIHFIFPLAFRELNLMRETELSLMDLLHRFFTDTKELTSIDQDYRVVFIFDGLDESRYPLDFKNNKVLNDVTQPSSVDVLLTNLMKGNLFPAALLWITSRPAATDQIPPELVDKVTEVRGFSDPQKEEYFRKRIRDGQLASRVITHIKSSRSLDIMCHIPVFCWISSTVLERIMGETDGEIPKTLTQMYAHFLIFQIKQQNKKYGECHEMDLSWNKDKMLSLGKLAFHQLDRGNLIFYEEDLRECGIDVREASVHSGMCTQMFREESGWCQKKVYSFVHLSIQEFLAALFVFLYLNNSDMLQHQSTNVLPSLSQKDTLCDIQKSAVDEASQSGNGHLDLFLRFLFGLSIEHNQSLLQDLLTMRESRPESREEIIRYIKTKISQNLSPNRSINLFYCLNELDDHSLEEEIQRYLGRPYFCRGMVSQITLSSSQWSALVFVLLSSSHRPDEFNLKKYKPSEECLLRLMPVVKESKKANLWGCNLTARVCPTLATVLSSEASSLRDLDLNNNDLLDSGVRLLCDGLGSQCCKLQILRLCVCKLTGKSCEALASALCSSSLRELHLSTNNLQDSGVTLLSVGLANPHCKLEMLRLNWCGVREEGCVALASALRSNPSHLRELELQGNDPGAQGKRLLSAQLKDPCCKLEKLRI